MQLLKELEPAPNAFPIRKDMASSVCCFNSFRARVIKANDTESIPRLPFKGYITVSIQGILWMVTALETEELQVGLIYITLDLTGHQSSSSRQLYQNESLQPSFIV